MIEKKTARTGKPAASSKPASKMAATKPVKPVVEAALPKPAPRPAPPEPIKLPPKAAAPTTIKAAPETAAPKPAEATAPKPARPVPEAAALQPPKPTADTVAAATEASMPGLSGLLTTQKKSLDAVVQANTVLAEGMQALWQRETERQKRLLQSMLEAGREVSGQPDPKAMLAKQAEVAKRLLEDSMAEFGLMRDTMSKAAQDAMSVLNARASEHVEEVKAVLGNVARPK